jgi:hypothetical protein
MTKPQASIHAVDAQVTTVTHALQQQDKLALLL